MRRALIFLPLALTLATPSVAQTPQTAAPAPATDTPVDTLRLATARELVAKLQLADRLVVKPGMAMNPDKLVEDCVRANENPATAKALREDCIVKAERVRALYEPIQRRRLPAAKARLIEATTVAYAKQLPQDGLAALVAFYKTPAGQRVAAAGPALDRAFRDAAADVNLQFMIDVLSDAEKELGE